MCTKPMCRAEKFGTAYINKQGKTSYEFDFFSWTDYEQNPRIYDAKYRKIQQVPCGKCIECRLEKSRQWANRIMIECRDRSLNECWFLTVTYAPEHIPHNITVNTETGEEIEGLTLDKKDISNFMKRLRRNREYHHKETGIKFYLCGEYGSKTQRPHYHIAIMGLHLDPEKDLKFYKDTSAGRLWKWEEGSEIWGKGFVVVGRLEWDSAAYVARYIMKKQLGPEAEQYYQSRGQIPEFVQMSRRPGIGREYYDKHKQEIYEHDSILVKKGGMVLQAKPPKYYDNLFDVEYEDLMHKVKVKRKVCGQRAQELKNRKTSQTPEQQRRTTEILKASKVKLLPRKEF